MIGAYVIYFGMAIYRTIAGIKLSHDSICKSVVYILCTSTNIVISISMFIIGKKLKNGYRKDMLCVKKNHKKSIQEKAKQIEIGFDEDVEVQDFLDNHEEEEFHVEHTKAVKYAIHNMNVIVTWFLILMVYYLITNIWYRYWSDDNCQFDEDHILTTDIMTVATDSLVFVWWLFPILYVFWPTGKFFKCKLGNQEHHDPIERANNERKVSDILYSRSSSS